MLYQLSYRGTRGFLARMTGFEPATSGVTGRRSKPLSYTPARTFIMAFEPKGMQRGGRHQATDATVSFSISQYIEMFKIASEYCAGSSGLRTKLLAPA